MPSSQTDILAEWRSKYPGMAVVRRLKSGKEADLWLVKYRDELLALKVYIAGGFSTRAKYSQGQWISEPSLRKAVKQKTKVGKTLQQRLWMKREYYLLQKLHEKGAIVPKVLAFTNTAILMQYLGDENQAAPRLADINLDTALRSGALQRIEASVQLFLENGIVHADLSPYNILWWDNQPWIIDFPQAADIRRNEDWRELYDRDLAAIRRYFNA